MDVRSVALSAGVNTRFAIPGRFFLLMSAAEPVTVRLIRNRSRVREVGRDVEEGYYSEPGDWRDPEDYFEGYELESTNAQTVVVAVSDRRGGMQTRPAVRIEQADDFATQADANVTTTVGAAKFAANANRKKAVVQHVSGAGVVRIGDNQITAARGGRIVAGGSYTIHSTGAIFARTESGAAVISILEEFKS